MAQLENIEAIEKRLWSAADTEDTLVQQTTAEYLEQELGWESVHAYNSED
jgi:hypothetical protein